MIRNLLIILVIVLPRLSWSAVPVSSSELSLDGVSVSELCVAVFRDFERVPYVLDPAVYADRRTVSVHLVGEGAQFRSSFDVYLSSLGYSVTYARGVFTVGPKPASVVPPEERFNVVYRPKYRDVGYLVEQLRPLVPGGRFTSDRGVSNTSRGSSEAAVAADGLRGGASVQSVSSPSSLASETGSLTSAFSKIDRTTDVLVFNGRAADVAMVKDLLPQLDVPEGDLIVKATVYEVTLTRSDGSALQLAGSVLSGKLGLAFGPSAALADALSLKVGNLSAILSALDQDSHFKSLSSPVARARSGSSATFKSGQEVPTLGSVSYAGASGTAVQSVTYRSAGVIFTVTPVRRESVIAVDVQQELSSFTSTTTGLNDTPTLNQRSLTSSLSVEPGQVVLLGGLVEESHTDNRDGLSFLPSWLSSNSGSETRREIILVLQVSDGNSFSRSPDHLLSH